jgi:hypothetical protein
MFDLARFSQFHIRTEEFYLMIELADVRNTLETTASKLSDFRGSL